MPPNSELAAAITAWFEMLWTNRGPPDLEYTTEFGAYADPSQGTYWLYRFMEATGLSHVLAIAGYEGLGRRLGRDRGRGHCARARPRPSASPLSNAATTALIRSSPAGAEPCAVKLASSSRSRCRPSVQSSTTSQRGRARHPPV